MCENVAFDTRAQRWLWSDCAYAQSDQNHRCSDEETLHPWLYQKHPAMIMIKLRECAGWSESSLDAHIPWYVFYVAAQLNDEVYKPISYLIKANISAL